MKCALWGFLFGSLGLFVLSALSLMSNVLASLFSPLFWPGRRLAAAFVGPVASDAAVAMLALANGVIYAVVFVLVCAVYKRLRRK